MVACFCSIVSSKSVGESLNLISVQLFAAAVRLPYRDTAMPCYCHAMDGWCARRLLLPACRRPQVFCWIEPLTCRAADQILVSAPNSCRPRAIRRVTSLASEQPGRFRLAQFLLSKKKGPIWKPRSRSSPIVCRGWGACRLIFVRLTRTCDTLVEPLAVAVRGRVRKIQRSTSGAKPLSFASCS